jgi:superfamily II RNA helicase
VRLPFEPASFPDVLDTLLQYDLTPAIIFLPSRRGCDEAVDSFRRTRLPDLPGEQQRRIASIVAEYPDEAIYVERHRQFSLLLRKGIAAHHAGQLPAWKHVVERAMAAGALRAVFATSTLAAGIDMPARSVVITASSLRADDGHRDIKAFELAQMTGRAGRRGRDRVGFAIFVPGPFQDMHVIAEKLLSPPEPVESAFDANYTMVLNLLQKMSPQAARSLIERSFRHFQNRKLADRLRPRLQEVKAILDADAELCPAGDRAQTFADYRPIARELAAARKQLRRWQQAKRQLDLDDPNVRMDYEAAVATVRRLEAKAAEFPCFTCPQASNCGPRAAEMLEARRRYEHLLARCAEIENGLWERFKKCVAVLQHYGYLDRDWQPTPDGRWAAKLRVDNAVFVGELIRAGIFDVESPRHLAALCGAIAAEDREFALYEQTRADYLRPLRQVRSIAYAIADVQARYDNYCAMTIDYDAGQLLWAWADGQCKWENLLEMTEAVEGDVARLLLRTADLLGQLAGLSASHPKLAEQAQAAIYAIRRPPVED